MIYHLAELREKLATVLKKPRVKVYGSRAYYADAVAIWVSAKFDDRTLRIERQVTLVELQYTKLDDLLSQVERQMADELLAKVIADVVQSRMGET